MRRAGAAIEGNRRAAPRPVHHDVRLAAATLEAIDNSHWIANSAIEIVRHNDRSLYLVEPEGTR